MNSLQSYDARKYSQGGYEKQGDGVYKIGNEYVTSLSFKQESDLGEGTSAGDISQYPLEDILDNFFVYISDSYKDLNTKDTQLCHLEFASTNKGDIFRLRGIIGRHVYNKAISEGGNSSVKLVIE